MDRALNGRPLAVVTGITGFIAQHVAADLIAGGWRVRGTLRDRGRTEEALAAVRDLAAARGVAPEAARAITFAPARLESEAGWREALEGAEAVLHVASPIPLVQPRDRDALAPVARDGALRVLAAARAAGTVRKVVLTSSVAAIVEGHAEAEARVFTEADWSDPEGPGVSPYARSKSLAERAAWEFMAAERPGFTLSVINPGLVLGPVAGRDYGVSPEVVRRLMAGELPGAPRLGWDVVDVRDVAALHLLALRDPAADGQRFIAASGFLWMAEMAATIREAMPEHARRTPRRRLPDMALRLGALFDPALRGVLKDLGREVRIARDKAAQMLGWTARAPREAVLATAESLVRHGLV